ncbi:hypothetical protein [Methylobacterium sp. Leaf469]|uniref:hypothetical protein n=1 Tax=Methylobacterium sp. Leaf469 TaxID=1736387 RepID=UPI0012E3D456|nr:hypothetical protein [Methylobacterium sp. Leaf469]
MTAYHWDGDGYQDLATRLAPILADSLHLAQSLTERLSWTPDEQRLAVDLTHRVFTWGRVRSRSPIDASHVQAVFAAALEAAGLPYGPNAVEAPWSSGWTKVAAFATAHLDHDAHTVGPPQVIWDSRVANAIRKLVDAGEAQLPAPVTAQLKAELRQIHGRGGERHGLKLTGGWAFAHTRSQKWTAQRAGSRLIGELRDALNAAPERFGKMPGSTHPDGRWTSWGVGVALFVEGY